MESRQTVLRLGCLTVFQRTSLRPALRLILHPIFSRIVSLLLVTLFLPPSSFASNLDDAARQLADRIAAVTGPGAIALELTNHSSLDERSVRAIRSALQAQLRVQGIRTAVADQSMGRVNVVLSESLREYVWTAELAIGTDPPRVVLVSLPHPPSAMSSLAALPITLKKTLLFTQEQPILDAALVDMGAGATSAGARLLLLDPTHVAAYRQQTGHLGSPDSSVLAGRSGWELETSIPIIHSRPFPRDTRGRLLLRRDHLFDVYLPGTICRSSATMPITVNCSASDDPWPLTPEENGANSANGVRAFYAPARNFFTGVLSPGIGKISNLPSFYSAATLSRSNYTLWVLAAVDGSIHVVDGITDQALRGGAAPLLAHFEKWGSDLASVHSKCGVGTELLVSASGDQERDTLRAFEIPDRDPVPVSSPLEFDGPITALWPDASLSSAVAIVKSEDKSEDKQEDTGQYEAYRISITCAN